MRVKIELAGGLPETEVLIRCEQLDESIVMLQNYIMEQGNSGRCLPLSRGDTEYYIPIGQIYFFETEGKEIYAHTAEQLFQCPYRLYELEELLPGGFMRVSKSTIANLDHIYSITRNLTASSMAEFQGSRKSVMVSRNYYRAVLERLRERRLKT